MTTAKYHVQQSLPTIDEESSRCRAYVIVVGLAVGLVLASMGGAMTFLAYFDGGGVPHSVADYVRVPTAIVGPALLGTGGAIAILAFLICTCYGLDTKPVM